MSKISKEIWAVLILILIIGSGIWYEKMQNRTDLLVTSPDCPSGCIATSSDISTYGYSDIMSSTTASSSTDDSGEVSDKDMQDMLIKIKALNTESASVIDSINSRGDN